MKKQNPTKITLEQHTKIFELKKLGLGDSTVAKLINVSPLCVKQIFTNNKPFIPLKPQENYNKNGENTLVPVWELDFAKGDYFCIDKWEKHHRLTEYVNR